MAKTANALARVARRLSRVNVNIVVKKSYKRKSVWVCGNGVLSKKTTGLFSISTFVLLYPKLMVSGPVVYGPPDDSLMPARSIKERIKRVRRR